MDWQGVALFNGNATAAALAAAEVCAVRIATQIKPDGEEWIELQRAVPSGYCQYASCCCANNNWCCSRNVLMFLQQRTSS